MLAWLRTGLALMGFGFVVSKFGLFLRKLAELRDVHMKISADQSLSVWIGVALVLLGVLVNIIASARFLKTVSHLRRGESPKAPKWQPSVLVALVMSIIGIGIAVYLINIR